MEPEAREFLARIVMEKTTKTPRTATRKTTGRSARTTRTTPPAGLTAAAAEAHDIARRAFELYCARGGQHGHDVDDWLQAERELSGAGTASSL
jgi:hypothetical protein